MHKRSHSICSKIQRCYKYKVYNKTSNQELELYIYIRTKKKKKKKKDG